ncbi:hypothetical protein FOL46_003098 [Perkinsus olseni]|uniref:Uncharacterized protein n=1 Tax=Perkinsus olseni TaxID=32597 RepID=A0A7J6M4G3_PEROL|nr:hypothetical protein FOL46_003098 [Perkinsus olseni]
MTIICLYSVTVLLLMPSSLEALHSSGEQPKALEVNEDTVKFGEYATDATSCLELDPNCQAEVEYVHNKENNIGDLCFLKRQYISEGLRLWLHLDREQEAFTYIKALSHDVPIRRNLIVEEDENQLVVQASSYHASRDGGHPKIEVGARGTEERSRAEEMLLKEGPFSPLAHLKGNATKSLINKIDWSSGYNTRTCETIYHFLAFHPCGKYVRGDLDWLFDFVKDNAARIQDQLEEWEENRSEQ